MCRNGIDNVFADCADIQIRYEVLEKIIVNLMNTQAALFLEWLEKEMQKLEQISKVEKQVDKLEKDGGRYRAKRLELYEKYKAGDIGKEDFLRQKQRCIRMEEDCLTEKEALEEEIHEKKERQKHLEDSREGLQETVRMEEYDNSLIHSMLSRIEVFHDQRLKLYWRFTEEFPESLKVLEEKEAGGSGMEEKTIQTKAAVYLSQLTFVPAGGSLESMERKVSNDCCRKLALDRAEIQTFYDCRDEGALFYKASYMKMIAAAKQGEFQFLVVESMRELYLSAHDLYNFLFWLLPKLPCCFISIEDGYASGKLEEGEDAEARKALYEKYKNLRNSDIKRWRALERKRGERIADPPRKAVCTHVYGYYQTSEGCFADKEALSIIKEMYKSAIDGMKPIRIARKLNEEHIPTPYQFFLAHGDSGRKERKHLWDGDKVEGILVNVRYVKRCPYWEICRSEEKHCDQKPIISEEEYQAAVKRCGHWQSRKKKKP